MQTLNRSLKDLEKMVRDNVDMEDGLPLRPGKESEWKQATPKSLPLKLRAKKKPARVGAVYEEQMASSVIKVEATETKKRAPLKKVTTEEDTLAGYRIDETFVAEISDEEEVCRMFTVPCRSFRKALLIEH